MRADHAANHADPATPLDTRLHRCDERWWRGDRMHPTRIVRRLLGASEDASRVVHIRESISGLNVRRGQDR